MKRAWTRGAAALAATMVVALAAAATPQARADYRAALKRAAAEYGTAMKQCRAMGGTERSVCVAEAKATLQRGEAEAHASYLGTAQARVDARVAEAKADYAVARAKCGAQKGAERKACIGNARATEQGAIRDAMRAAK